MPISSEHKEILSTQSESKTLKEWLEFFNHQYTRGQVYGFCYHNGFPLKKLSKEELSQKQSKCARKYHINQDYFKTWSNKMAYILGLWFADGCIYKGKMFDITLHARDKYILKKIAEELQYEGGLYDYVDRQAARINFSCVVIYNDIIALGGEERKSLTVDFPDIPKEYIGDFIRGFFDGDGSVMYVQGGRINTSFCCGSKKFRDKLWKVLKDECGVQGGSYDARSMSIRFGLRDSILIGKFMYKNNPDLYLKRKRDKFQKYLKEDI